MRKNATNAHIITYMTYNTYDAYNRYCIRKIHTPNTTRTSGI